MQVHESSVELTTCAVQPRESCECDVARLPSSPTKSIWNVFSATRIVLLGIVFMRGEFNSAVISRRRFADAWLHTNARALSSARGQDAAQSAEDDWKPLCDLRVRPVLNAMAHTNRAESIKNSRQLRWPELLLSFSMSEA